MNLESATLEPRGKRLIVELLPDDEKTEGGIIIADTVAKDFSRAIIRFIGDEIVKEVVGDKILIPFGNGREVVVDGKKMKLIFEEVIEAKI